MSFFYKSIYSTRTRWEHIEKRNQMGLFWCRYFDHLCSSLVTKRSCTRASCLPIPGFSSDKEQTYRYKLQILHQSWYKFMTMSMNVDLDVDKRIHPGRFITQTKHVFTQDLQRRGHNNVQYVGHTSRYKNYCSHWKDKINFVLKHIRKILNDPFPYRVKQQF